MFAHTNLITYESLYSSSYLLNEYLLYDKLWGPSQRVVTLFALLNEPTMILCSSEWTNYDCLCSDEHKMDNNLDLSMSIDKTLPAERLSLDRSGRTLK